MSNIELEIRVVPKNKDKFLDWLLNNAEFVSEKEQEDIYFDPPHKTFIYDADFGKNADEYFRIRRTQDNELITYKHWHRDEKGSSLYADEFELGIEDSQKMLKILESLGFNKTAEINKKRTNYRYENFLFSCDDVKNIGFFIEIEYLGDSENIKNKNLDFLRDKLKDLNIGEYKEVKNKGYVQLFWNNIKY